MAQKQKKDPKPTFKDKLIKMDVGENTAEMLVNFVIPEAIDIIMGIFPSEVFENVFIRRKMLWKYGGLVLGWLFRLLTNVPKLVDEVVTEVSREIVQGVERRMNKDGLSEPSSDEGSPRTKKEKDDFSKIVKMIASAKILNEDDNVKVWDEFIKLKTYFTNLNPKEKIRFAKFFSELSPVDYLGFISMGEAERSDFLNFFFNQPEVPHKNYLKEYYEKAKTFVKTNAKKFDDTLAKDQPLGIAIRNLLRIPNSN